MVLAPVEEIRFSFTASVQTLALPAARSICPWIRSFLASRSRTEALSLVITRPLEPMPVRSAASRTNSSTPTMTSAVTAASHRIPSEEIRRCLGFVSSITGIRLLAVSPPVQSWV